jgi:1,4-dihydroxy-2-naphthoate polyprenyltransferase
LLVFAKHIDKHDDDKAKGVGTFPVRVGEKFARRVDQIAIVLIYAVTLFLILNGFFTPIMLIVFLAYKEALAVIKVLNHPKPADAPEIARAFWPVWFSGFTFQHNRQFGGYLILGLILDALLKTFFPTFWTGLF